MANGYLPRRDGDALAWMQRFARGLAERGEVYKATPEEVGAVVGAVEAFGRALGVASNAGTRTAVAVIEKDGARAAAEVACRPVYGRIKADPSIEASEKVAIGVRPPNPSRARIAAPTTAPALEVATDVGHAHVLRYAAPGHVGRAKPAGVVGVQVFRRLLPPGAGPSEVLGAGGAGPGEYVGTFTRNPITIPYTAVDDLKVAAYTSRWITRRGETGPWSNVVGVRVTAATPALGKPGSARSAA